MDTGKVKIVLDALREELRTRRAGAAQPSAQAADDASMLFPRPSADATPKTSGNTVDRSKSMRHSARASAREREDTELQRLMELRNARRAVSPTRPRAPVAAPTVQLAIVSVSADDGAGAELSQRPIPELVVPFAVSQEPLVRIAPYVVRIVAAAVAAGAAMLLLL
jgi:hypothetical protein